MVSSVQVTYHLLKCIFQHTYLTKGGGGGGGVGGAVCLAILGRPCALLASCVLYSAITCHAAVSGDLADAACQATCQLAGCRQPHS